ncbi:MliC family protein [Paraburkholderia sp. CNPSo 3272]|uniref:MliC family protein n=1 Tax=Paraburkholderia sp. CNPSo 3272 TaxID=2940931 RepID=UPI0020B7C419|nr:MliC family protein [Paraburkholderia sp. CNPSo 3272]MCP3726878.1 MliC family protein [Paraburkholderia sp. CNPSo 3272]
MKRRRSRARERNVPFSFARALAVPALACALAASAAHAASGNAAPGAALDIRDIHVQSRHTFSYTCANSKTFKVTYLNAANGQSFAVVPVKGRKLLFVGVIAASGVKYVADRYTWWTKGPGADLYDVTSDASPKPVLSGCATIMR